MGDRRIVTDPQRTTGARATLAPILGVALVVLVGVLARTPGISARDRAELASRFRFTRATIASVPGGRERRIRDVHPSLERLSAWISSVGAAVALHDLDGDGIANDVVVVDPRTDRVTVSAVPGTGARFSPFVLDPAPLPLDHETMAPMGCLPGDFNEDGLTDVLVYYWGRSPVVFLRRGLATPGKWPMDPAAFVACESVAAPERWFTNAATLADLDGDGHLDVYVGNYFPDGANVLGAGGSGRETMQHSMSRAWNGGKDHVLLGTGRAPASERCVPFREVASGLSEDVLRGWTLAAGAADLDGDLRPELYLGNDFGPDRLLVNHSRPGHVAWSLAEGRKTFTTPSSKVLGHDSFKGMGVDFGDVNGDGRLDIYVSNISNEFALLESHFLFVSTGDPRVLQAGIAPFVDESEPLGLSRSGWSWDCRLADFDNDGTLEAVQATGFLQGTQNRWPELQELAMANDDLIANPRAWPRFQLGADLSGHQLNAFFVRGRDGRFHDIAQWVGLDERQVARGLATADVDGDGDLDLAIANQWSASSFYRNDAPAAGAFLGLHLLLPVPGEPASFAVRDGHPVPYAPRREAIGAEARVELPSGSVRVAQVDGGNGHSGKRSPDLHFGLGTIAPGTLLPVTLRWRDGEGRVRSHTLRLAPGWHTVTLGEPGPEGRE